VSEPMAGMYRVNDPTAPKLVVGRFTVLWQSDREGGTIWVQDGEGEGAEMSAREFTDSFGTSDLFVILAKMTEQ